jgi:hypothetical protein
MHYITVHIFLNNTTQQHPQHQLPLLYSILSAAIDAGCVHSSGTLSIHLIAPHSISHPSNYNHNPHDQHPHRTCSGFSTAAASSPVIVIVMFDHIKQHPRNQHTSHQHPHHTCSGFSTAAARSSTAAPPRHCISLHVTP